MSETETETVTPRSYETNFIGDANFANFSRFNEDLLPMNPIPNEYKISYAPTMESQIRKLRLSMETYRELMLQINSILLWEKQWHPTAIIGACTVLFTLVWLSEPNVLTILSLMGLLTTICDYVLPGIISSMFKNESWSTDKQKQYEEICTNIILYKTKLELLVTSYYRMRLTNPKLYFSFTIFGLLFLVWIGGAISNLFLTYMLVLGVLLLPGMSSNGMLNRASDTLSKIFTDLVENAKSKYFSFTIFGLLFLVWIGGAISNLFLTYMLVLGVLLLPGMSSNGMLNRASDTLSKIFTDLVENAKSKYFSFTIFGLLFLVWIGGAISNLFLTYMLVLGVLLLPGMSSNGMLNRASDTLSKIFTDLVENAKSKVSTKKLQ